MKILIGTYEVAGLVQQYKVGFQQLGHEVTTAVTEKFSWYDYEYDFILNQELQTRRDNRVLGQHQFTQRLIRKIKNTFGYQAYRKFILNLIDQHDVIIQLCQPFLPDYEDFRYIRRKGKKLVCLFTGSESRYFEAFRQQFDVTDFVFPSDYTETIAEDHLKYIRNAERYADLVFSLPDQAGLQLRPYYHLHIPMNTERISFRNNQRQVPKILHAPSAPYKKGSDIIEQAINKLTSDGLAFEFASIRNLSNRQVLDLLEDADILADEIVLHGPGILSFEAMAGGCAVATRHLEESPACFKPPVYPVDAKNIYSRLKELIVNFEFRQELIEKGRKYVEKNNDPAAVTSDILQNLSTGKLPEYEPLFLQEKYEPKDQEEAKSISKWNRFVSNTEWYQRTVKKGVRAGIKF